MSEDPTVVLARMEVEQRYIIEALKRQEEDTAAHRAKVEKSLTDLSSRVTVIETQLTGSKAFVKGFRLAVLLAWTFVVGGGVALVNKILEGKW